MPSDASYALHKKKYTQISVKKRQLLVQLVIQQGKTLSEAGRKMHINPSTVRLIIKKYKQSGSFFMKKLRNMPKQLKQAVKTSQIGKKTATTLREPQQTVAKVQADVKPEEKVEAKVKIEETKPNSLEWYYPFLQYGLQY